MVTFESDIKQRSIANASRTYKKLPNNDNAKAAVLKLTRKRQYYQDLTPPEPQIEVLDPSEFDREYYDNDRDTSVAVKSSSLLNAQRKELSEIGFKLPPASVTNLTGWLAEQMSVISANNPAIQDVNDLFGLDKSDRIKAFSNAGVQTVLKRVKTDASSSRRNPSQPLRSQPVRSQSALPPRSQRIPINNDPFTNTVIDAPHRSRVSAQLNNLIDPFEGLPLMPSYVHPRQAGEFDSNDAPPGFTRVENDDQGRSRFKCNSCVRPRPILESSIRGHNRRMRHDENGIDL